MARTSVLLAILYASTLHAQLWEQRANMGQALLDATGFAIGPYGYVFGGYNGSTSQQLLWRYSPDLDVWGAAVNFPGTIVRACAGAGLDGMGYVFGGRTGPSGQYSSALWAYDPSNFQWTQKASKPGIGLAYASAFALNARLYVFGGSMPGDTYSNELWEYRPDLDEWTMRASLPAAARSGAIAAALSGKGYIIGGNDASANFASKDVWEYDPVADSWTQKADMPGPERRVGCGFVLAGLIHAGGGWDGTTRFTDFYTFDPTLDLWTPIADFGGVGAYTPVGFAIDNIGFVATGGASLGPTAQCWAYVDGSIGVGERSDPHFQPYRSGSDIVVVGWEGGMAMRYAITDAIGRTIATGRLRNGRVQLGKLSSGAYLLLLVSDQVNSFTWKFIIGE